MQKNAILGLTFWLNSSPEYLEVAIHNLLRLPSLLDQIRTHLAVALDNCAAPFQLPSNTSDVLDPYVP
jgi:hypothetical protein